MSMDHKYQLTMGECMYFYRAPDFCVLALKDRKGKNSSFVRSVFGFY